MNDNAGRKTGLPAILTMVTIISLLSIASPGGCPGESGSETAESRTKRGIALSLRIAEARNRKDRVTYYKSLARRHEAGWAERAGRRSTTSVRRGER